MKFLRKLLWLISIVIIIVILAWAYLGGFKKLVPSESVMGPYTIAYVDHVGNYKELGEPMQNLYDVLSGQNVMSTMGIGIFYDDPSTTAKEELKSEGGVIINKEDFQNLDLNNENYKVKNLSKTNYAIVEFPYKNMMSYMVGPMKAYPILWEYLEDNDYSIEVPGIEIYDVENKIIYYMAEIK